MPRKKSSMSSKKQSSKIKIRTLLQEKERINSLITEGPMIQNNFSQEVSELNKEINVINQNNLGLKIQNENFFDEEDIEKNKYIAVFAYLPFLFIIPLFLKRESQFCQKHARQGLVWFALQLVTFIFYFVPIINIFYGFIILVVTLNAFFRTLLGQYWRVPFLYKWSEKINL